MSDEYVKKVWIVEHTWVCSSCGASNKGRDKKCAQCGAPKDGSDREIIPSDMSESNAVTDQKLIKQFSAGADWICSYCNHHETKLKDKCSECGSAQGEKKSDVGENVPETANVIESTSTLSNKEQKRKEFQELASKMPPLETSLLATSSTDPEEFAPKKFDIDWKLVGAIIGVLVMIAGFGWLMYYLFTPHETTARITETRWTYSVSLRERSIQHGRDWQDRMEAHAFNVSCHREIRSYHNCDPYQCNPHQETYSCNCRSVESCTTTESCSTSCSNNNNGSSTCSQTCRPERSCTTRQECDTCSRTVYDTCYHQCPDYDDMCEYDYPSWNVVNHAQTTDINHEIIRPNLNAVNNVECVGDNEVLFTQSHHTQCTDERIQFRVNFSASQEDHWEYSASSLQDYNRFLTNSRWHVRYTHAGSFEPLYPLRSE